MLKKVLRCKLWNDYEVYIGCTSMFYIFKGAFDLLKNKEHVATTQVVQCLICKIVSGTR